jgi:phosphoglycolate phosphatase-like HAD superfamily hydrolase
MELLRRPKVIFWDFDGVIKDSIEVKTQAFVDLFRAFGVAVVDRVREHHLAHGGMSRFDKVPIYLQWGGTEPDPATVAEYCDRFGQLVLQGVIDAPWVPGVEVFLRGTPQRQAFIVVSATPQNELAHILRALDLTNCFTDIFGAPTGKKDAIRMTLAVCGLAPTDCLMIGDARADFEAAQANAVPFLLRRHDTNAEVFATYTGPSIKDFLAL